MATQLASLAGWYFLPNLVTGYLQSLYYGITIRAGEPKPQPGSTRFIKHRRAIHVAVIVFYLLYTIYEADWQLRRAGDFYQDLSVPHDVDDRALQSRFRRITVTLHPDKIAAPEARPAAEARFVHLKLARDILIDPAKRFAYDRFGPDMLQWQHCITVRDYLTAGAYSIAPFYMGSAMFVIILTVLEYMDWGRYWRFFTFAAMLVFEAHVITHPGFPVIATKLINPIFTKLNTHPPYLPFQLVTLARKFAITVFIAVSQLAPILQQRNSVRSHNSEVAQQQQIDRLDMLAKATDLEIARLLTLDMTPFAADEEAEREIRAKMKEWIVQSTVDNDPEVRDAIGRVRQRRRAGVPAGARGAR